MLRTIADVLKTEFHSNQLYRVGGDGFTVFIENDTADLAEAKMQKVQEKVEAYDYRIAVGIVYREQERGLKRIIQEADERMLKSKQDLCCVVFNMNPRERRIILTRTEIVPALTLYRRYLKQKIC